MRKRNLKMIMPILILALLLGGCSGKSDPQSLILGTWYPEGSEKMAFTFYDDGTCEIANEYGTGKWAIVNDNLLKVTNYYGEADTVTIDEISKGKLVLSSNGHSQTFVNEASEK